MQENNKARRQNRKTWEYEKACKTLGVAAGRYFSYKNKFIVTSVKLHIPFVKEEINVSVEMDITPWKVRKVHLWVYLKGVCGNTIDVVNILGEINLLARSEVVKSIIGGFDGTKILLNWENVCDLIQSRRDPIMAKNKKHYFYQQRKADRESYFMGRIKVLEDLICSHPTLGSHYERYDPETAYCGLQICDSIAKESLFGGHHGLDDNSCDGVLLNVITNLLEAISKQKGFVFQHSFHPYWEVEQFFFHYSLFDVQPHSENKMYIRINNQNISLSGSREVVVKRLLAHFRPIKSLGELRVRF